MIRHFSLTAVLFAVCVTANAASVSVNLKEVSEGSWEFWATATPEGGDTQGVAAYAISVKGLAALGVAPGTIDWVQAPLSVTNTSFEPQGFGSVLKGAVGADEYSAANTQVTSTNRIFGIGAQPVFVDHINPAAPDVNTAVPALLGTLVIPSNPTLTAANFQIGLSLFPMPFTGQSVAATDIDLTITPFGIVDDPVFESTPAPGSTLDFGYGGQDRTLSLATSNTGGGTLEVVNAVIEGANADLFRVNSFAPYDLVGGAGSTNLEIEFLAEISGGPGTYLATLNLVGEGGAVLGTYALTAQVPEPSTVALASLSLVGLVGFMRRRS